MGKDRETPGTAGEATPAGQPPAPEPAQEKKGAGRQRSSDDSFTGRAAQFAVLAELMRFRCNAAIPEVDLGTDMFAFRDDRAEMARLQVKGCAAPYSYADGSGYSAKFPLPMKQFRRLDDEPPLFYALAVLREEKWVDFLVVSRARLQGYHNGPKRFGSLNKSSDELELTVEFRDRVTCSGQDLTDCRNAWRTLPPLWPVPDQEKDKAVGDPPSPDPVHPSP